MSTEGFSQNYIKLGTLSLCWNILKGNMINTYTGTVWENPNPNKEECVCEGAVQLPIP